MAFALIDSVLVNAQSNPTTAAIDTTGADLIVIGVSGWTANFVAPTDSKGNSWTALTQSSNGDSICRLYYCAAPTVGTGHTFSVTSGSDVYATIMVLAFSGAAASPFDQQNTNGSSSGVTSISTGSVTPSEDDEVVVAIWGGPNFDSASVNGGFTLAESFQGTYSGGIAYLIQTSAAAANPTGSWTSSGAISAAIATFKAGGGGGGGVVKTINGLAIASVKTVNGLAIASVKTWNGAATQ